MILLCGGDKRTQQQDIRRAQKAGGDIVITKTTLFDAADYLDTEERQAAYVAAALESGDADFVRDALGLVARARGMSGVAKKAGLNRESLYKALGETGKSRIRHGHAYCPGIGSHVVGAPGSEWADITAAPGRVTAPPSPCLSPALRGRGEEKGGTSDHPAYAIRTAARRRSTRPAAADSREVRAEPGLAAPMYVSATLLVRASSR